MSAQEVRDQVITIFLAGHETTAMAMTWTWFLLSQHPQEESRLHAELDSVLGGRAPTHEDLSNLTYTRMVIEESMRLYPPVHTIAREAISDDTLVGQRIPKGSAIMIAPWLLHRHVKHWDNPGRFDPERVRSQVERRLKPHAERLHAGVFHAVGGAWRNFALLAMRMSGYPLEIVQQYEMTRREALEAIAQRIDLRVQLPHEGGAFPILALREGAVPLPELDELLN